MSIDMSPVPGPPPGFDLFDQGFLRRPHDVLRQMRADAPVFYDPSLDMWVVSRYETVRSVFRDSERFSAKVASQPISPWCDEAAAILRDGGVVIPPLLVNNDPPDHHRHRRFLGAPFARSRIRDLEPMVVDVVASRLDALRDVSEFDMVREVTWEVPVEVLFRFMGVPPADIEMLKRWTASRVRLIWGHPDPEEQVALAASLVEYAKYSDRFIEYRSQNLGDDYTSELLRAVDGEDGDPAQLRREIAVNFFNLLFAGHETTTNMMTNAVHRVLSDPPVWRALRDDPTRADAAAEEAIRLEPSVISWRRRTNVAVELDGVTIPEGQILLLMMISANHDEAHFERPDEFDFERANVRDHLAFGFGIHACLGAQLARMQISELLRRLATDFATLELDPDQELTYLPNTSFRGAEKLLVRQSPSPS